MAARKGISELRPEPIHIVLSMDAHLTLMMELMLQRHVLLITDRFVVLSDKGAQNVELVLKLAILHALHISFLREMIALNLQIFDFSEQVVDAAGSL